MPQDVGRRGQGADPVLREAHTAAEDLRPWRVPFREPARRVVGRGAVQQGHLAGATWARREPVPPVISVCIAAQPQVSSMG